MPNSILVVIPAQESHKKLLEAAAPDANFIYSTPKTVTPEQVRDADVIVGNVPAAMIAASPKLKLLQLNSAGTDAYIKPGVLAPQTVLTNATGAYGKAVAEHLFAMGLAIQKKLHLYRDDQNACVWGDEGTVSSISDATVLVVGLGDIGTHFARMAKALGAYTIGVKRRASAPIEGVDEIALTEDLDKLLPRADIVASFLPGTGATRGMYNAERFQLMKPTAIFLNGGRGGAVDTDALVAALENGTIFAAGLDVTDPEPLPADHPLWKVRNAVVTPHISGGFHLPETFERIVGIAARNLAHFTAGESFENEVDFTTGYRK